jgi:hypothetical protein
MALVRFCILDSNYLFEQTGYRLQNFANFQLEIEQLRYTSEFRRLGPDDQGGVSAGEIGAEAYCLIRCRDGCAL